jgi:hypothetical protein
MSTSKKAFKKPNLNIEITPETEEEKGHIENMLRASKSAKNVHELKKFNFNKIRPGVPYHQDKLLKQDKI